MISGPKIGQPGLAVPFFGGEFVVFRYACPYLWALILWCFLPDKFPMESFRHFYAVYVSQRRANMSAKLSFDCDPERPRIESQTFVSDCRDKVLWHRIYVIQHYDTPPHTPALRGPSSADRSTEPHCWRIG
jgi:hypothetical protein